MSSIHEECLEDDTTILDEDWLLRRIPNWPRMYMWCDNEQAYRPTSANFKDNELSVSLEKDMLRDDKDHSEAVKNHPGYGLLKMPVRTVRHDLSNKQAIKRDPTNEDPYHALVLGEKSKGDCRKLRKASEVVIEPEQ